MTRYEQGFLTKCAEYGIDGRELLKQAYDPNKYTKRRENLVKGIYSLVGGAGGAAIGSVIGGKKGRFLKQVLGTLGGGAAGYGVGAARNGVREYFGYDPLIDNVVAVAKR